MLLCILNNNIYKMNLKLVLCSMALCASTSIYANVQDLEIRHKQREYGFDRETG